ncbi:hypothetical protein, partial [Treponema sp. R6D11]
MSLSSIKKEQIELNGIEVLRPAIALMQSIPLYVNYSFDNSQDEIQNIRIHISELLSELKNNNEEYFYEEI